MIPALKKRRRFRIRSISIYIASVIANGLITVITRYHSRTGSKRKQGREAASQIRPLVSLMLIFNSSAAFKGFLSVTESCNDYKMPCIKDFRGYFVTLIQYFSVEIFQKISKNPRSKLPTSQGNFDILEV